MTAEGKSRVLKVKGEKRNFTCVWAGIRPTDEELEQILADHKVWVETHSDGYYKKPETDSPHDLSGIIIRKRDLSNTNLGFIKLEGAELIKSSLIGADLRVANLKRADLRMADLKEAFLFKADLYKARVEMAKLKGANLDWANMKKAVLFKADLESASLMDAKFQRAALSKANLKNTELIYADFKEADLGASDLRKANLAGANIEKAFLRAVKYNRWGKYRGIRLDGCHGSPRFVRFAKDQEFIEEFRAKRWRFWLLYLPWLIFADCGRSFSLWAAWSVLFAFLFGFAYANPDSLTWLPETWRPMVSLTTEGVRQASWFTPYYFSIVTFTTLGFGDITPLNGWAAFWITLEVILGYIMLGGLISILANKLARRS